MSKRDWRDGSPFEQLATEHATMTKIWHAPPFGVASILQPQSSPIVATGEITSWRFKRVAMRCEKSATNYRSFVALACGFIWIKSVHMA
jgi:hypothetical protein